MWFGVKGKFAFHDGFEGIVAKGKGGTTQTIARPSWLKIQNPNYTQWDGPRELFEGGRDNRQRRERWVRPQVVLV
jgi:hypothetical protein